MDSHALSNTQWLICECCVIKQGLLVKLDNGKTLILETKGQETRRDKEKRKALSEWTSAVNQYSEFGAWCNDVSYNVADVDGIIARYL